MQPERRTSAPGTTTSLDPDNPPPALPPPLPVTIARPGKSGLGPSRVTDKPGGGGGGGVLAHPSQVVGDGEARQGRKV